ncbi:MULTISPECIES: GNAT family N-acetyltransferase [Rhodomicrobium]|uniref:GNAT family N-acetyltransferase n=1 Tax=Rhodomicrobium TaxID=1068 RepID=UPI000B4AA1D7|nr:MULTISPECIES: GNAT family N-acetyltransferase [Rhodomicrobium]
MDFAQFNAYHMPALEQNEARHNVLLAMMARAADEAPPPGTRKWSYGVPGACAWKSPVRGIVLGDMGEADCAALAEEVAGTHFHGVLGADETARWFVRRAEHLGTRFKEPIPQHILAISRPPIYPGAPGEARAVTLADADLFAEWYAGFLAEAAPDDVPPERAFVDRKAASGDCVFWTVDGEPVAVAGIVRRLRNAAALAIVYTPHAQRGRGYAGSATAAVVERIYAEGRQTACLYVDLRKPAPNRCYAKIGFTPVCKSWFFLQLPPAGAG